MNFQLVLQIILTGTTNYFLLLVRIIIFFTGAENYFSRCGEFIFNRAAMGRARFLIYPLFFFNHAAMGRARFII